MLAGLVLLNLLLAVAAESNDADTGGQFDEDSRLPPTIMVAILVRNKAHTLPYFLHYFERLQYPKDRMALWIRADHNIDNSLAIMAKWLQHSGSAYNWVDYHKSNNGIGYSNEEGPCDWTRERFQNIIELRQEALDAARKVWADYLFFTDLDNILMNEKVLLDMIHQQKTIVAPMLNATASEHYTNFWGDMDVNGYYKRSPDYKDIQLRHKQGCYPVALVHSTVLIDLRNKESAELAYSPLPPHYSGPRDDLIIFAHSAKYHGVPMYILNKDFYGYMQIPMEPHNTLEEEREQFLHLRLEAIVFSEPLQKLNYLETGTDETKLTKLGFDQIYMINLERRRDRRMKMEEIFKVMNVDFKLVKAVDGRQLNDSYLKKLGIEMLPHFSDPYKGRPMTMGEVGCFLSHYMIWEDVVKNGFNKVIVLEDDIRFEMFFKQQLQYLMDQVKASNIKWDLIYIGRKRLKHSSEIYVSGVERLVWPEYSYWTLGYLLSQSGAQKLLAQGPLGKLLPVDEYLPVMFDKHPEEQWYSQFSPRDLVALSAQPLLLYPTHYTGEPGYITDTEDSEVVATWNMHGAAESTEPAGDGQDILGPGSTLQRPVVKADGVRLSNEEL